MIPGKDYSDFFLVEWEHIKKQANTHDLVRYLMGCVEENIIHNTADYPVISFKSSGLDLGHFEAKMLSPLSHSLDYP